MISQLGKDVALHSWFRKSSLCPRWWCQVVTIYELIQLRYLMIGLTLHCPANSHTAFPSRGQFTVNQKSSLWPIYLKYSMTAPPLVSKRLFKNFIQQHIDAFFFGLFPDTLISSSNESVEVFDETNSCFFCIELMYSNPLIECELCLVKKKSGNTTFVQTSFAS